MKYKNKLHTGGAAFLAVATIVGATFVGGVPATYAVNCNKYAKTINDALCMQDMNNMVRESMELEKQYTLRDSRDGKSYTVAKMKDGYVWMTQNLDLNLSTATTLTPLDTDVSSNWTPTKTTKNIGDSWIVSDHTPESIDVGDYYWDNSSSSGTKISTKVAPSGIVTPDDPEAGDDETDDEMLSGISDEGDAHYHLGNYYNWTAAVAMNDSSEYTPMIEADQSICPAGWTLPRGLNYEDTNDGVAGFMNIEEYYETEGGGGGMQALSTDTKGIPLPSSNRYDFTGEPFFMNGGGMYGAYYSDDEPGIVGIGSTYYWLRGQNEIRRPDETDEGGSSNRANKAGNPFEDNAVGLAGIVDYYGLTVGPVEKNMGLPIRCVARPRDGIIDESAWSWVEGQVHVVGEDTDSIIRIDIPLEEFVSLSVDGEMLTRGVEYEATSGSTILTLKQKYLDGLYRSGHSVTAVFTNGRTVETELVVLENIKAPNTGRR